MENQNIPCKYVVEKDDFEVGSGPMYFLAFEGDFLILDIGTAPDPRILSIYDLNSRKEVYTDYYSKPIVVENNTISYWNPIKEKVTEDNCPKLTEYTSMGLGAEIESHVLLSLNTFDKKELGEYRCRARQ